MRPILMQPSSFLEKFLKIFEECVTEMLLFSEAEPPSIES
jgi:hypothetical protein